MSSRLAPPHPSPGHRQLSVLWRMAVRWKKVEVERSWEQRRAAVVSKLEYVSLQSAHHGSEEKGLT